MTFMEIKSHNELSSSVLDTEGKHNWYTYLHTNLTKLWEQTKLMEIMTKSQIDHYLFDCHKLKLNLSEVKEPTLSEFVRGLLHPLKSEMADKNISLEIEEDLSALDGLGPPASFEEVRTQVCTDWEIYRNIMVQLAHNAVKYSYEKTTLQLRLKIVQNCDSQSLEDITLNHMQSYSDQNQRSASSRNKGVFKYALETHVVNYGVFFDSKQLRHKKINCFSF